MPEDLIVLKQGDTWFVRCRLRKRGSRAIWNVIGATIVMEWWREGVAGTPIVASNLTPGAIWGEGYVWIPVGPLNVTEKVATVTAVVRVDLDGESVALPHEGHITFDIQHRGEP